MKWIGQHIWDFISRFRGDVYIENLSTTTETDVLVVDSDGKVSKNTIEDLHHDTSSQASVDNSGSTYIQDVTLDTYGHVTGLTSAAIPTLNQDTTGTAATVTGAAQTNITSLGTLTNLDVDNININGDTITAANDEIIVDADSFVIESATNGKPNLDIKTTYAGNKPANIYFKKDKGAAGADDDFIGRIYFVSDNDAQVQKTFAQISGEVRLAANGAEEGRFIISIKNTNNTLVPQDSFSLTANGAATDVNLGFGTTSVTTISGNLRVSSAICAVQGISGAPGAIRLHEDSDNGTNRIALSAPASCSDREIALPDADGTVQLQGSNTGQTFSVPLKVDDIYILYVSAQNYWYHTGYVGQNFGTSIGSELDSTAMRGVSYVATSACKVNKVTIAFYMTSGPTDLEFQVTKIPLVDGSNSNVTLAAMTHNDINFSASANYNYVKTMTMTGAGSDNALTAGQAFTLAIRRTDASATRVLYGNCFAEIELT